jgi:hypothetical protein
MTKELRLGFHRLGRWLEDPVNLGVGLVAAWAIVVLTVAIPGAVSLVQMLLLILAGGALTVVLSRPITRLAARWKRGRLELERARDPGLST